MLIGLSTAILWDYKELDISKAISHAVHNLSFEAVEIHCQDPFFKGWGSKDAEETKRSIKDTLSIIETEVSIHAPYHDTNIATLNSGIGREVMRQLRESIKTAHYLDSEIVVVHPGFVSSRKYERKVPFKKMVDNLKKLTEFAEDLGVKVCLENLSSKKKAMCVDIEEIKKVNQEVNMENLRITFDIAHANTTETGPLKYAKELKDYIGHIHVSDNTGDDNHLSIGQGNIDFGEVLGELMPYDGILTLEGWIPTNEDPFLIHDRRELERIRRHIQNP